MRPTSVGPPRSERALPPSCLRDESNSGADTVLKTPPILILLIAAVRGGGPSSQRFKQWECWGATAAWWPTCGWT